MVSILLFQASLPTIQVLLQELHRLVLVLSLPALAVVLRLRTHYHQRVTPVAQVQAGPDQDQGLNAREVTPSTLQEVALE